MPATAEVTSIRPHNARVVAVLLEHGERFLCGLARWVAHLRLARLPPLGALATHGASSIRAVIL